MTFWWQARELFKNTEYWKYFVCFGKWMALSACGFQMGVQAENIQRLQPHLLCSTASLTVQRWALIFYTVNCVVPKMDSGQAFDVATCLGCWIPWWVSLPLFDILIVVTTKTQKFPLITGALGNNALKEKQKLVCLHNISHSLLYEEIIKETAQIWCEASENSMCAMEKILEKHWFPTGDESILSV